MFISTRKILSLLVSVAFVSCSSTNAPLTTGTGTGTSSTGTTTPSTPSTSAPTAPSSLVATATTAASITLTWSDNSTDETTFRIYRSSTIAGSYVLIGTVASNVATYVSTGLSPATTYYYKVSANNGNGESATTSQANATTLTSAAPSALTATPLSSVSMQLAWNDNSSDETSFLIERSFTAGAAAVWVTIATLPASTTKYTDVGLFPSTTYYYRVTSQGGAVTGVSNTAFGTTFSGEWLGIGDSSYSSDTGAGLSRSTRGGVLPSTATDASGRIVTVWEDKTIYGVNAIYMMVYDPSNIDENGANRGWLPVGVNITAVGEVDDSGNLVGVTFSKKQTSNTGLGFSMTDGDAQKPKITFDSTRNEFLVVWQQQTNSRYEIYGRRMRAGASDILYNQYGSFFNVTLSNSTYSAGVVAGSTEDDSLVTPSSTWNLSSTANGDSVNPSISSIGGTLYAVWEEYLSGTRTWQIYGSKSTIGATAVYPAIPAIPVVAAIDTVGGTSNAGTGISAAAATDHARHPSVVASDATHIYVGWSSTDPLNGDSDVSTNFCDGNNFGGATVIVANAGSSQNPSMAIDKNAASPLPYIAWEDNSLTNRFNVYALQGNLLGTVWSSLTASGITSGDTTTTGISASSGNAQKPSIAVADTNFYVSWQDTNTGLSEIYVKKYVAQDSVPGEDAAWIAMGDSDSGGGISDSAVAGYHPDLYVSSSGMVIASWQDYQSTGMYQIYLRRW